MSLSSLVHTDECAKIGTARGSDCIDRKTTEGATRLGKGEHRSCKFFFLG